MRYPAGSNAPQIFKLPARVYYLWPGNDNDVWVTTVDGIFHAVCDRGVWTVDRETDPLVAHGSFNEIAQGQHGEIWAIGVGGLFHCVKGQ